MSIEIGNVATWAGPATVRCAGEPAEWAGEHRSELHLMLRQHGGVLVTDAGVRSPADLAMVRAALAHSPAAGPELFAPRTDHGDSVYSWPEWAADRDMCLHHEQGHGVRFPGLLVMGCLATPERGGAMLLGDTRAVLANMPAQLAARFEREGWRLVRNFRPYLGLSWREAFGTADPGKVTARCADSAVGCSWSADGTLRTAQRRSAVVAHPATGERCWFNDIAFFSQWSVAPAERGVLLSSFGAFGLPFNTCFGGGDPLAEDDYDAIMEAYDQATIRVTWGVGDLLLVDNVLMAHGREPYTGGWGVAVALADPTSLADCAPTVPPAIVKL